MLQNTGSWSTILSGVDTDVASVPLESIFALWSVFNIWRQKVNFTDFSKRWIPRQWLNQFLSNFEDLMLKIRSLFLWKNGIKRIICRWEPDLSVWMKFCIASSCVRLVFFICLVHGHPMHYQIKNSTCYWVSKIES